MGGGEGNFQAAGILLCHQIPCTNFFFQVTKHNLLTISKQKFAEPKANVPPLDSRVSQETSRGGPKRGWGAIYSSFTILF